MRGNTKIHPDKHGEILELSTKISDKEIADFFRVKESTIYAIRKKHGYLKPRPSLYKKDESYFETMDKAEKFYMLGLMYSDGFLVKDSSIGLSLHPRDEIVLDFFKKELGFTGPTTSTYRENKKFEMRRVDIHSKKLYDSLVKLNLCENKSLKLKWPCEIEDSPFVWNFILGVFDGDGSISITSRKPVATITGSPDFCSGLSLFLIKNGIKHNVKGYKNTIVQTIYISNIYARIFCERIIQSQIFSMPRKRQLIDYISFCYKNLLNKNGNVKNYCMHTESFSIFKEKGVEELFSHIKAKNELYTKKSIKNLKR